MIMKEVLYLAHYLDLPSRNDRNIVGSPAAMNKIEYIFKTLGELNVKTTVISAYNTKSSQSKPALLKEIYPNVKLRLLPAFKRKKLISRIISKLSFEARLLICLLQELKRVNTLIVYHSLPLMRLITILKLFRRFNLILEVEEIYGDVNNSSKTVKKELRFFKLADGYIFPTKLLDEKVNLKKKPTTIIHGTYEKTNTYSKQFKDNKIHIVYAGTLDVRKGGAMAAVAAAEFLNDRYHLHILGFGSKEEKNVLLSAIKNVAGKSDCTISYDGCLAGEEYLKFLQSCDIGLSTQNPEATFNDSSFPSKVLSYMSNGLRVVSIRIPVVESSAVNSVIWYYDIQSPEEIAKAIQLVDMLDDYNGREVIGNLDIKFQSQILELLEKF